MIVFTVNASNTSFVIVMPLIQTWIIRDYNPDKHILHLILHFFTHCIIKHNLLVVETFDELLFQTHLTYKIDHGLWEINE